MNTRKRCFRSELKKLKQRSSNQPLLVRGSAEWKRLFHTFLWRMCLSLSSLRVGSVSDAAVRDVGVKFLTLLNEFPRKGGRGQKRGEIQARFQFPISASSPSALSQMYRGKKRRERGRTGKRGGNEDDSQDRQNFEKGRKERRRPTASFFLPLRQPAAPLNPKSKAN